MDSTLLRSWLGLPPGPWPADHYALLGLPPGPTDPAAVEAVVMDRMDRLRVHQLRHPELVTEGMNRLAQALIALTDPAAKAAYDAELGLAAPPAAAPKAAPPDRAAHLVVAAPVAEEEVAEDEPRRPEDPDRTQEIEIPAFEVVEAEPAELPEPERPGVVQAVTVEPAAKGDPESRRWIYARLALLRKSLRTWEGLAPVIGQPGRKLARPANVLVLLEGALAVRPLLPQLLGVIGGTGEPGGLVAAVVTQPLLVPTFRDLLPDQRAALARDWERARSELRRELRRLRRLASPPRRRRRRGPGLIRKGLRWLAETPELALVVLAVAALLLALFRGALGVTW